MQKQNGWSQEHTHLTGSQQQALGHCQKLKLNLAAVSLRGCAVIDIMHASALFSLAGASSTSTLQVYLPITSLNFPLPLLEVHISPRSHTGQRL